MMEKNVFPLPAVKEYYNANFINARFDMEKGEGREIAMKYGVRSYPTYLFLNGDGELILKNYGYMGEQDFLTIAKEANDPKLKNSSYKELFEKGEKNPDFLLNMMKQYAQSDYELAKKVSERYFTVKKNEPLTRDDLGLLLYFTKSTTDPNYKVFVERKQELVQQLTESLYEQFDTNIKISKILENSLDQKTGKINDKYFYEKAEPLVGKENAENALNRLKVNFYPTTKNFPEYEKAALKYYKNYEEVDSQELLKAAWIFSENVTDKNSLLKAQEWAEKVVMKSETAESTFILAKLYAKTGKTENALMYAKSRKIWRKAKAKIQLRQHNF